MATLAASNESGGNAQARHSTARGVLAGYFFISPRRPMTIAAALGGRRAMLTPATPVGGDVAVLIDVCGGDQELYC